MCGVVGLILGHWENQSSSNVAAADLHESLFYLQHRGQDACGIATCATGGRIYQCKGNGMAAQVFHDGKRVADLPGYMGIGHLRYPTAGTNAPAEAQPFYVNSPHGICLSHNGNLLNAPDLSEFLDQTALRHINTDSDSELMLNIFAYELQRIGRPRAKNDDIFHALSQTYERCQGGFACTAMVAGFGIIGFRDPAGIRPLIMGSRPSETMPGATDYMLASEDIALRQLRFSNFQDILPGQAVFIEKVAHLSSDRSMSRSRRPQPPIYGISVFKARQKMGEKLADKLRETLGDAAMDEIDAVIPIPETATTSAAVVAERLGKPYCQGYVKNRYVFRTFIAPGQEQRQKSVRRKLTTIIPEFAGRCVLLVDDSIVRGTTSREIVTMAREAGARKVIFSSCSPPITHPHIYGIDLATASELIAHNRDRHDIASLIGADEVIYQDLDDLIAACAELSPRDPKTQTFESGVFSGKYITDVPEGYFEHLNELRGNKRNAQAKGSGRPVPVGGQNGTPSIGLPPNGMSKEEEQDASAGLKPEIQRSPEGRDDISIYNIGADLRR